MSYSHYANSQQTSKLRPVNSRAVVSTYQIQYTTAQTICLTFTLVYLIYEDLDLT